MQGIYLVIPKIRLRIHLLAPVMLGVMLAIEGAIPFLVVAVSALWHELGHLTAIKLCGERVRRVDIIPIGAVIVRSDGGGYKNDAAIALSGPIFSLLGAIISAVIYMGSENVYAFFGLMINAVFALFNLLPLKRLDGGCALFALMCNRFEQKTAEAAASAVSMLLSIALALLSVAAFVLSDYNAGVLLLAGALLSDAACADRT